MSGVLRTVSYSCDVLLPIYYFRFLHEQPFDTSLYYIYVYVIQHLTKVTTALNSGSTRSHQCNGDLSRAAVEVLLRVDGSATCNANAMSLGWSGGRSVAVVWFLIMDISSTVRV